ncbi:MAG: tyrosine-type recombinase/integrase [Aeromonas veronii]
MKQYNERKYLIVDENGLPIPKLCEFTLLHLSGAEKTQENNANHLIHIERWAAMLKVDLADTVAGTGFADMALFQSFIRHLEHHSYDINGARPLRPEIVSPDYFNQRLDVVITYFEFLANKAISKRRNTDPLFHQIPKMMDRLTSRLIKLRRPKTKQRRILGLSLIQQATLYEVMETPSLLGWNNATQLRNRLILTLLLETGIRKGELLSLATSSCHTSKLAHGVYPFILTQQNVEHDDPRKRAPREKTVSRIIPISFYLASMIDEYKLARKSLGESAMKSPYLFLATTQPYNPLSIAALDYIFLHIKDKILELSDIHPHKLRHTFFENLDRILTKLGIEESQQKKLKNIVGGWAYNSNSSLVYEVGSKLEQSNQVLNQLHAEIELYRTLS